MLCYITQRLIAVGLKKIKNKIRINCILIKLKFNKSKKGRRKKEKKRKNTYHLKPWKAACRMGSKPDESNVGSSDAGRKNINGQSQTDQS